MAFNDELLAWYTKNARPLPWRMSNNPYYIWLSEIILQQTRVEQGMPYYHRFTTSFPTLKKLAAASEEEVLRLWQGLGYYSRGRNLLTAAKQMMERHGRFPSSYEEIRNLKGIGDYTAAAIASFAYNLPHAVVDGNVYRFYSRYFGIKTPIDTTAGKKEFAVLAEKMLDKRHPGTFNQAVMEMGALVCKPKPLCNECPFAQSCVARKENKMTDYPVKQKSVTVRNRYFYYLMMEKGKELYIKRREGKDIWQGLYDFPMIETERVMEPEEIYRSAEWKKVAGKAEVLYISDVILHKLSHQNLYTRFIHLKMPAGIKPGNGWLKVHRSDLSDYGMPQLLVKYLKANEKLPGHTVTLF